MSHEFADQTNEKAGRSSISKTQGVDVAHTETVIDFGGDSKLPPPPNLTPEQEKKLWRKIDLRLMPILSLMYLFSFLDRGESAIPLGLLVSNNICCSGNVGMCH